MVTHILSEGEHIPEPDSSADKEVDVYKILDDLDKPPHTCQHTIPVGFKHKHTIKDINGRPHLEHVSTSVSRLRCACGTEIDR